MNNFLEHSLDRPIGELLELVQQRIMTRSTYFGVPTHKNPLDLWVYQEMIFELQPTVIIEIGNKFGGSTLALAHMLDILNKGRIIAVDIDHSKLHTQAKQHPRISFLEAAGLDAFKQVEQMISSDDQVLVIEDSSHTFDNTLEILRKYSSLVSSGSYLIVEDSICHHGLDVGPKPGPYEAIEVFCAENGKFTPDRMREDFLVTWNPTGFLKRIS